ATRFRIVCRTTTRDEEAIVIATLGGLGAAVMFAVSALAGSTAARQVGSPAFTAWMNLVGLVVLLPVLVLYGGAVPAWPAAYLMLYVGTATLVGLLIIYSALREGSVSVVIPIVSAEGAVSAGLAWASGETPSQVKLIGMIIVVASVATLVALS